MAEGAQKGRKAEDGPIDLRYQLTETNDPNYLSRTRLNVDDSDATLIFTMNKELDGGSKKTREFAEKLGKPCRHIHPETKTEFVIAFLQRNNVGIIEHCGKKRIFGAGDLCVGKAVQLVISFLRRAKALWQKNVTKEDVFYYVYGFLHSNEYRETFANDLKKMLPRLPLVEDVRDFWAFSKAGRKLAKIHLNYESVAPHPDVKVSGDDSKFYTVEKMRFPKRTRKTASFTTAK